MRLGDSPLKKKEQVGLNKSGLLVISTALMFVLISLDSLGVTRPAYVAVSYFSSPVQYYFIQAKSFISEFYNTFANIGNLRLEITDLKRENTRLKSESVELTEAKKEIDHLKRQLSIPATKDFDLIEADVIGGDPSGVVSRVRINLGKKDGVEEGMTVVYQGILVGKINDVMPNISSVSLLTDPDSNVPAINQRSRHQGLIHGSLGGLVMEDILQNEDTRVGDKVVTLGDRFPRGLLIGTIQKVLSGQTSSKKSAVIDSALDYSSLEKVYIVTNYLPDQEIGQ